MSLTRRGFKKSSDNLLAGSNQPCQKINTQFNIPKRSDPDKICLWSVSNAQVTLEIDYHNIPVLRQDDIFFGMQDDIIRSIVSRELVANVSIVWTGSEPVASEIATP